MSDWFFVGVVLGAILFVVMESVRDWYTKQRGQQKFSKKVVKPWLAGKK